MCVILCDELSHVECSSASQSQHGSLQLVLFPQVTPTCQPVNRQFGLEEAVPVPPLASFFPCKLCGKWVGPVVPEGAPGQTLSVWSHWEPTDGLDLQSCLFFFPLPFLTPECSIKSNPEMLTWRSTASLRRTGRTGGCSSSSSPSVWLSVVPPASCRPQAVLCCSPRLRLGPSPPPASLERRAMQTVSSIL